MLPRVTVIEVTEIDQNGDLISKPLYWKGNRHPPLIYLRATIRSHSAPGLGDRLLARLTRLDREIYEAVIIKKIEKTSDTILGILTKENYIIPVLREKNETYKVFPENKLRAEHGDLVVAKVCSPKRNKHKTATVLECLGKENRAFNYSHISIHLNNIPNKFSEETIRQTSKLDLPQLENRTDLRSLPLVTIDSESARDFDDAVFAEPWVETRQGWHIIVSIADVAWFVRPETPLDIEAKSRGNSVYFPDRVLPMLPEQLSNDWCSLIPGEDRFCLAVHIWIDKDGNIVSHKFERAVIRSHARLTYSQVQAARDGFPDPQTSKLIGGVIKTLFSAYESLLSSRQRREPLELNIPEIDINLDKLGNIVSIVESPNLESHRLIEEFMITANIVAAKTLQSTQKPFLYRVHNKPPNEKLAAFTDYANSLGLSLPNSHRIKPSFFNRTMENSVKLDARRAMHDAILRTQSKAHYDSENRGHFGLALNSYCHFTSPIRRYADLLIHRALISTLNLGDGGNQADVIELKTVGRHLSLTEQRATQAERDAKLRYSADFLLQKIGERCTGIISGVTKSGLFVYMEGFNSEGFLPIKCLPDQNFYFDKKKRILKGKKFKKSFGIGDKVEVFIENTNPINGSITLNFIQ